MNRTANTSKNIIVSFIGQGIAFLTAFIGRMVFAQVLGAEYFGVNGLFSSIITILSLGELGLGSAVAYSLYKPLAAKDHNKIAALMQLYKNCYLLIGLLVIIVGLAIMPLLPLIIGDWPQIAENIYIIYMFFVLNTACSYVFAYKRILIIADQKAYVVYTIQYGIMSICSVMQIVALLTTGSYMLFLIIMLLRTLLENYLISARANSLYLMLKQSCADSVDKQTIDKIIKNSLAAFCHKVAGIFGYGLDGVLITHFVNIATTGYYSNYRLIVGAVNSVMSQVFVSATASIGNLSAVTSVKRQLEVFYALNFISIWLYGVCSIGLYQLLNPFILLCFGREYVFSSEIVSIFSLDFYLIGLLQPGRVFAESLGIYWHTRYKPIIELMVNLSFSIVLGMHFGLLGILLGKIAGTALIASTVEPYILYKYGFRTPVKHYFYTQIRYSIVILISLGVTQLLAVLIDTKGALGLVIMAVICILVPSSIIVAVFFRCAEFRELTKKIKAVAKSS